MKLWKNGYIHTLENENSIHQYMVTHHKKILSFNYDPKKAYDEVIDLHGAHVYPGFVDAHLHILGYGEKLSQINLSSYTHKKDVLSCIKKHYQKHITFYGLTIKNLNKNDLDAISNQLPIIVKHSDYHTYSVNQFVLDKCHIKNTSGILDLNEIVEVNHQFIHYDIDDLEHMITKSIQNLYSYGITGGHSDDLHYFNGYIDTIKAFKLALLKTPFRAQLLVHYKELNQYREPFLDQNEYLQLGPVKIFYDGTLSSKTALLNSPYKNTNTHGTREMTIETFTKLVMRIRALKLPVAVHVIGDKALDELLDILLKYPPHQGLHDRLIHASFISQSALDKLSHMPIIIDIQPQFIESDFPKNLDILSTFPNYIHPYHTLLKRNITICGSSDAPVETPNPLLGMYEAISRQGLSQIKHNDYEKLSRYEAIKLYTTYANIPTYHKNNRGLIKENYIADFTIFKEDLFKIDINDFLTIRPIMTVVNEEIVYQKKASKSN
jgi:predicted amidohydrolase YtcJ